MGLKRPFEAEEMQECNAKHARQLCCSPNHLNQLDESIPYHVSQDKTGVLVEDMSGVREKKPVWRNDANHVEKHFDTCAPFSWISTGLFQEGAQTQPPLTHQSSETDFIWRPISPVGDVYTCLMNQPPKKQVPVGSDHQADIPECVKEEILRSETRTNDDIERKLMGKCITPMPDSDVFGTGQGRKECICSDKGSVRCVRRHIMEARESLIEGIGYERFTELGLCEMGDEVTSLWSEDEEDLFHKVVYSNPVSLGRDFWKQLKETFPSRTMKERVSYYFNVFILRRRAIQNRFKTLDADSDDDEWQVEYDVFCSGKSLDEEDNNGRSSSHEEEETSSSDDGGGDEEESPVNDAHCVYMDKVSSDGEVNVEDDSCMNDAHCVYKDKVSKDGEVNVEDDSCLSFELQDSNLIFSHSPMENSCNSNLIFSHSPMENRECHRSGDDLFSFDDACDRRLASSDCWTKNNDLLPTSNIIEEIFGQDELGENDDNLKGK